MPYVPKILLTIKIAIYIIVTINSIMCVKKDFFGKYIQFKEMRIWMKKYQIMFSGSIVLIAVGLILGVYGLFAGNLLFYVGGGILVAGLALLGNWVTKAYTYICKDCYMRIDVGIGEALFALPAGNDCRRIYCPKCRHKTICKARRIPLRRYVF